eukprot:6069752-Amphidinium_carterae.1
MNHWRKELNFMVCGMGSSAADSTLSWLAKTSVIAFYVSSMQPSSCQREREEGSHMLRHFVHISSK